MYRWWVFIHIAGVFAFLVSHGVSMAVLFQLRSERNPARVTTLLDLSSSSISALYVSLALLLIGGVVAGFVGDWWSEAWIWTALGLLLLAIILMYALASPYYRRVRVIARAMADGSQAVSREDFDGILRSRRPLAVAWVGFGAILLILYLMLFKPALGFSRGDGEPAPPGAVEITAEGIAFDSDSLTAPAGDAFTLVFDNRDGGVPHNVAIYRDESLGEPLFVGEIFDGPREESYQVPALDQGSYYFRCDVHPQMDGTLTVE